MSRMTSRVGDGPRLHLVSATHLLDVPPPPPRSQKDQVGAAPVGDVPRAREASRRNAVPVGCAPLVVNQPSPATGARTSCGLVSERAVEACSCRAVVQSSSTACSPRIEDRVRRAENAVRRAVRRGRQPPLRLRRPCCRSEVRVNPRPKADSCAVADLLSRRAAVVDSASSHCPLDEQTRWRVLGRPVCARGALREQQGRDQRRWLAACALPDLPAVAMPLSHSCARAQGCRVAGPSPAAARTRRPSAMRPAGRLVRVARRRAAVSDR